MLSVCQMNPKTNLSCLVSAVSTAYIISTNVICYFGMHCYH